MFNLTGNNLKRNIYEMIKLYRYVKEICTEFDTMHQRIIYDAYTQSSAQKRDK